MKIPTLTTTSILYTINRDRAYLQDKLDKRKTFFLTLAIFTVVSVGVILWIIQ